MLKYTTNYTQGACAIECKLEKVVDVCGCKPYYFPGTFKICAFEQLRKCAYLEIGKARMIVPAILLIVVCILGH